MTPGSPRSWLVFWMEHIVPTFTVCGMRRYAREVIPLLVVVVVISIRPCRPDHLGHRVCNRAELRFAFAQGGFCIHLWCDVSLREHGTHWGSRVISNRACAQQYRLARARRVERFYLHRIARRFFAGKRPRHGPFVCKHALALS